MENGEECIDDKKPTESAVEEISDDAVRPAEEVKKDESRNSAKEPEEEDDIPLDLILKEEQIEVINNGTVDDSKDEKSELCAFENCGLCQSKVTLGSAKLLGCLHTFCSDCLEKQELQRANTDGTMSKVLCPVCRCLTPRSLLAENHFVKIECEEKPDRLEAKKNCGSCEDEGDVLGVKFCLDCNEWLCAECLAAHKRVKLTKNHQLSEQPPKVVLDQVERYCPEHPSEPLQLFCDSCDALTCRDCQLQKHRDHRYDYVKEAAARERHMLLNAQPSLLGKHTALIDFQKIALERLSQLEQREDLLTNEIDSYIGEIIAAIKQKQEEFHKTVAAVIGERKKEVNGQLNTSKKLLKAINHSQNFVRYIEDSSKTRGLLCARKLVKDYFNLIIREPTPTMTTLSHCNVNISFNKNNNLIHNLISNQLATVHYDQPIRPAKHMPQMMGLRPNMRSGPMHMAQLRAQTRPQNVMGARSNSTIPTQVQQITQLQRQQRQAQAAAVAAGVGPPRLPASPSAMHQHARNQYYSGGQIHQMPPQAPSPQMVRSSPVMSPNLMPCRPHSTDSGHSSDIARQPAATPPIISSTIKTEEGENEEWCAVCWEGGELLCCDSCPKVFHLDCHVPEIKDQIPEGTDFNCSICVYRKGNCAPMSICRFIFISLMTDRELDKLQHFSSSADRTPDYRQLLRHPVTYGTIRTRLATVAGCYTQVEHMLSDLVTFLNNIKKYSAEREICDVAELAKHKISGLIRISQPTALHYWMSLQMRPVSPLRNFVKRIAKPKNHDSDSEDEGATKRVKVER